MSNANSVLATGSHCSVIKSRSSAALTLATGGFCFALVRMFNGHAPGYSNCHSGLVRFDVELLQQPSAPYPHSATVAVSPSALIVKSSSSTRSARLS